MTALLVLWHVIEAWREKGDARRRRIQQAAAVIAGLLPGALALASVNTALYGSPLRLGYARASDYYSWSHVAPNIVNYFGWFVETQTVVAVCGLVLLFLPFRQLWPPPASRSFVAVMAVFVFGVWAQYWLFLVFEVWWYLRMLLPSWPFIMVGTGALAALAMRSGRPVIRIAIIVAIFFLGVRGVIVARDRAAFIVWRDEMRYGAAAMHARRLTAENSVVLTLQHSGSMRYYGGRVTLRWDYLPADWLDRAVAWMRERGVHSYALLDAAELPPFRERFATQRTLVTLGRPIFVYDGKVRLYDLVESSEPAPKVEVIAETATGAHCIPPAPQPTLSFAAPR
jgi:hypothetical protein